MDLHSLQELAVVSEASQDLSDSMSSSDSAKSPKNEKIEISKAAAKAKSPRRMDSADKAYGTDLKKV